MLRSDPRTGPRAGMRAAVIGAIRASTFARYAIAVGAGAVAILVRLGLEPVFDLRLPYITLFPAIVFSAWLGGLWPGLLTALLCALAAAYFWIEPAHSWVIGRTSDLLGLLLFVAIGGVISALNQAWRRGTSAVVESERRLAEAERERATLIEKERAARVEAERVAEQLELITSRTPLLLARCSRDGRYVFVNRACANFLGRPSEDIVGKPIADILGHEAYTAIGPYVDRVLRGELVDFEIEIPYAHTGRRFMRALYTPDRNARGDVIGWVATVTDMTERKRVEDDLRRTAALLEKANQAERAAKQEAERANHLKDQFLATVSHELRAPLNAVLGWAEMLRTGTLDDARRQRALQAVCTNARRQAGLIGDLLDVSSIVSGKMQVTLSAVDLRAVVRGALETVQPAAEAKGLHVQADIDPSVGNVLGDGARLQQILSNLLTNAVKFSPDPGVIHLVVQRTDDGVEMIVRDHGIGIAAEFLPKVFEPFRQADGSTTRAYGGLGLGLAIVKHLVEAHGGTVDACSAGEGQGATFTVRLPMIAAFANEREGTAEATAIQPDGNRRSLNGVTVLVVDDDPESRELVTVFLEDAGALVFSADSAAEALKLLEHERVDVLVADIAMPGEDGYALIRKVRALESRNAKTPAAALTAFSSKRDEQRSLEAGFQLHLSKPVESGSLVEAVANLALRLTSS